MVERHFTRGSGVFVCRICGRRTRVTTQIVTFPDTCGECEELAGLRNALWDGCFTVADIPERDRFLAKAVKNGGDEQRIRTYFDELFAFTGEEA